MANTKKQFYDVGTYTGHLQEGSEIRIQRYITYQGIYADFKPFLNVPTKELEKRLQDSKAKEKKIYEELGKSAQDWDEHGAQTLLLQKAIEYLKTPEVKHTANQWKQREDGIWEISNLVYKMTYSIQKAGDEWKLTWELEYTAPGYTPPLYRSPYDKSPRPRIEREGSKKYKTLEGAQKYIQGKYDEYAHLFEELSPPIPPEAKAFFCVNEQLLQGYTIAPKERAPQEVADELLDLLDDGDLAPPPDPEPPKAPEKPSPPQGKASPEKPTAAKKRRATTAKKSAAKKTATAKKQSAPVR